MSNSKFNTPSPASLSAGNLASPKRPRILSAMSKTGALYQAKVLHAFLQESTSLLLEHGSGGDEVTCGYLIAAELLTDLLDAANGEFEDFMGAVKGGGK